MLPSFRITSPEGPTYFSPAWTHRAGLKYIGPDAEVIRKLGSKAAARTLAQQAGVPVVPGSDGPLKNVRQAKALADQVGYPVLLKASDRKSVV